MTAIEAHFDGKVFVPEQPVNLPVNQPLRLLLLPVTPALTCEEPTETEWLQSAGANGVFDFLKDEAENIYLPTDGKPFIDER